MNQPLRASSISLASCLITWVSISALLSSPAFAQVNGSGPSPASGFNTVLNLPGNETVITGAMFERIGGTPGQTVQLNVGGGGTLGVGFGVDDGAELNISGGSVGDGLFGTQGGEVNISGGTVGIFFEVQTGTEVNISGGTVGNDFIATDGSLVNISGGTVGNGLFAINNEVNISGGTIGDEFVATDSSVVNLSGGSIGDDFRLVFFSVLNISGGTIGDGFFAQSAESVNILGSEFFLDGVELDNLVPDQALTITDRVGTLSGLLADGEQFSFELDAFGSNFTTLNVTLAVPEPSSAAFIAMVFATGLARRRRR